MLSASWARTFDLSWSSKLSKSEPELAEERRVVEVRSTAPAQGVARHPRAHARAVVDEGDRGHVLRMPLHVGVPLLEEHVEALGARLDRVVDDLAGSGGGIPVAVSALGFHRLLGIEER